jgi:uncharacterized protein YkwD
MPARRATLVAAGLSLGWPAAPAASPAATDLAAARAQDRVERAVVRRVNAVRARHGRRPLRRSVRLAAAADRKAREVVRTDTLSHRSPDGAPMSRRVRRYVSARRVGETLGLVRRRRRQAARVVRAWMASPGHRVVLLAPGYRRIGVGRRRGRVGGARATAFAVNVASAR